MRLLLSAGAAGVAALALAVSASAGLWIDLDRSVVRPGQVVHGKAVSPCALCGPRSLYLADFKHSGLQLLKRLPRQGDPHFVFVGRFTWKRGGKFSFVLPRVRPGLYALHALYRNGSAWTLAPASTVLRVQASSRVSFGPFSIIVPKGWYWRSFPGFDGTGAEFANWSLAGRHGFSPDAALPPGAFILWINPLGEYGSVTRPTIQGGDFMGLNDPARTRGHARADHSYCARGGRCFSITFEFGSNNVPRRVLLAVNRALESIHAAPLPRL